MALEYLLGSYSGTYLLKVDDVHDRRVHDLNDPSRCRLHGWKQPLELLVQVNTRATIHHGLRPLPLPVRIIQTPIRGIEGIGRNDVSRQCSVGTKCLNRLSSVPTCLKASTKLLDQVSDQWFNAGNGSSREEWIQGTSTKAMSIMRDGAKHGWSFAEHLY